MERANVPVHHREDTEPFNRPLPHAAPVHGQHRIEAGGHRGFVVEHAAGHTVVHDLANGATIEVAELRLIERLPIDGRALRVSMFRQGRAIRPVGFRNGVRATVYPISQLARRLRGG